MHKKVLSSASTWTARLISNYKAILKVNSSVPNLKLISYTRNRKYGEVNFVVQVSGKNIFPKLSLKDLENYSLLSNFSEIDQKIIRNFLSRNPGQPEMRIIARTYDRTKKQFIFTIESLDPKRKLIVESLSDLMQNIHKFDKEDYDLISLEAENNHNS